MTPKLPEFAGLGATYAGVVTPGATMRFVEPMINRVKSPKEAIATNPLVQEVSVCTLADALESFKQASDPAMARVIAPISEERFVSQPSKARIKELLRRIIELENVGLFELKEAVDEICDHTGMTTADLLAAVERGDLDLTKLRY